MYNFNFQSAASLDDAAAKLGAAEDGTLMAGGQTLLPVLKHSVDGGGGESCNNQHGND